MFSLFTGSDHKLLYYFIVSLRDSTWGHLLSAPLFYDTVFLSRPWPYSLILYHRRWCSLRRPRCFWCPWPPLLHILFVSSLSNRLLPAADSILLRWCAAGRNMRTAVDTPDLRRCHTVRVHRKPSNIIFGHVSTFHTHVWHRESSNISSMSHDLLGEESFLPFCLHEPGCPTLDRVC